MKILKALLVIVVVCGIFGMIGYFKYVKQDVSPINPISVQTSDLFKNLISNKTLPTKAAALSYTKINAKNGYSFKYRKDIFDAPNSKIDDLKSGQDNGYALYYKGTQVTFLTISVQDNSLERTSDVNFDRAKYLSGSINGHESRTRIIAGPNLYGKFLGAIVTFIAIDNGKKTLLVYAYPIQEADITYYNEIINSLVFN